MSNKCDKITVILITILVVLTLVLIGEVILRFGVESGEINYSEFLGGYYKVEGYHTETTSWGSFVSMSMEYTRLNAFEAIIHTIW